MHSNFYQLLLDYADDRREPRFVNTCSAVPQDQKVGYTDYPFLDDDLVNELEKKLKA